MQGLIYKLPYVLTWRKNEEIDFVENAENLKQIDLDLKNLLEKQKAAQAEHERMLLKRKPDNNNNNTSTLISQSFFKAAEEPHDEEYKRQRIDEVSYEEFIVVGTNLSPLLNVQQVNAGYVGDNTNSGKGF